MIPCMSPPGSQAFCAPLYWLSLWYLFKNNRQHGKTINREHPSVHPSVNTSWKKFPKYLQVLPVRARLATARARLVTSDFPIFRISNFLNFRYSEFPIFQFCNFPIFQISDFPIFRISKYPIFLLSKFPIFRIFRIPYFPIFRLSDFSNFQFSEFRIFPPSAKKWG